MDMNMQNGKIRKEILERGTERISPENDTKVKFYYKTTKKDGTVLDDNKPSGQPLELMYGKQFKLEVWEECLKTMELHETAKFSVDADLIGAYPLVAKSLRDIAKGMRKPGCNDHDHGETGHRCCGMQAMMEKGLGYPDLDELMKAPEPLDFTLELVEVLRPGSYEKDSWAMDETEKRTSIPQLHEEGNHLYKKQKYVEAADRYSRALGLLEELMAREQPDSPEWKKLDTVKDPLLLNYVQCQLILGHPNEAIEHATSILEKDPTNVKARYRRAKAHVMAWNPKEAREDFAKALELDRALEGAIQKDLRQLDSIQKQRDAEDRERLRHLFG